MWEEGNFDSSLFLVRDFYVWRSIRNFDKEYR